jgi:hypothetical protein
MAQDDTPDADSHRASRPFEGAEDVSRAQGCARQHRERLGRRDPHAQVSERVDEVAGAGGRAAQGAVGAVGRHGDRAPERADGDAGCCVGVRPALSNVQMQAEGKRFI